MEAVANIVRAHIEVAPNFPKPPIQFQWYGKLLADAKARKTVLDEWANHCKPLNADAVVALDARGFSLGMALADRLDLPLVYVRKPGKLPGAIHQVEYSLEYGTDKFEIEANRLKAGDQVLVIDDLVATGGTAEAACKLVEKCNASVAEIGVLIELTSSFLNAREERLKDYSLWAVAKIEVNE